MTAVGPDGWRAMIIATAGLEETGPFLLPPDSSVTFGRADQCGIRLDDERVSREIAQFQPTPHGWVVVNGNRTQLRAESLFVPEAIVNRRGQFLLQTGADWTLTWGFDVDTTAIVSYRKAPFGEALSTARDAESSAGISRRLARREGRIVEVRGAIGTVLAGDRLKINDGQRRILGAVFAWLIEGRPKPDILIGEAMTLGGFSEDQIKGVLRKVMKQVNDRRAGDARILSTEQLGLYLVDAVGALGPEDIPWQ